MGMIKRLLVLDGVNVVCHFRDDGSLVEGYGLMSHDDMARLARFTHDYRRMAQGNADQLSMLTGMRGWTPPRG
jgi:roadblock/LC7 domain-containing protein